MNKADTRTPPAYGSALRATVEEIDRLRLVWREHSVVWEDFATRELAARISNYLNGVAGSIEWLFGKDKLA